MPEYQFLAAVGAGTEILGWREEDLGGAWYVTTGHDGLPVIFLRLSVPAAGLGVLEMSCPLARNPTDDAFVSHLAMNGGLASDGAQFSNYVADDGQTYLGAFAKLPVPAGLWFPPPVAEKMWIGGRGIATLRARFQTFAAAQAGPVGEEPLPTARTASPPKLAAVA